MTALALDRVTKAFGARTILRDITLEVASGDLLAVLGPSGSGKTTLLRLICGFERSGGGTIRLGDDLVSGPGVHRPPERRHVGYVAQDGALFPHLSVADNIAFGLARRERRRHHRVAELLELVGLPASYAARPPQELSGGEQQRVSLARALAPQPGLVLLDEPFSSLDAGLRVETREAVAAALRRTGATAVLVTHDQAEALSMGDRVAVLRDGVLVQVAAPETLYRRPADIALARFLGEAVVLPGEAADGSVHCLLGRFSLVAPCAPGGVEVLIRPEQIRLAAPGIGHPAVVEAVTYYGHDCSVSLSAAGLDGRLTALVPGYASPVAGAVVSLQVEGPVAAYPTAA
ncbi:MAG: ABC transporter ATP-binding protein [Proteobacteria bacterium]|nr:ABC transporter ATP-binding protein [Pseudomonadota bacterium]